MEHLSTLNERQREAALHIDGPLLIVAGAGAGKTKTITHRIAHMIEMGISPQAILAVTFTNKAAGEMRERIEKLLVGMPRSTEKPRGMPLVVTFHALGVRLLREFSEQAGLPRSFVIWDRDDSLRAVKAALKELGAENRYTPRHVLGAISRRKGDGLRHEEYAAQATYPFERTVSEVWEKYEAALAAEQAVDFDDLIVRTLSMLRAHPSVRATLNARWRYITIDEYQDTNRAQYEIAHILSGETKNICVVGDMDQCLAQGTKVRLSDGSERAIEAVKKGDMVLSNYGSGDFRPARVMRTKKRVAKHGLVRLVMRSGRELVSTPEHTHFAGYRLGVVPQMYFTYLMRKQGVGFRIGVSQVYTNGQRRPVVGFQQRCNQEYADELWVIAAHDTQNEARMLEYQLSLQYQIPTLPFVARKGLSVGGYVHDQSSLTRMFALFDTETAARRLLSAYGLSLHHPHHRAQATNSSRRNVNIVLCGDRRGKTAMHRIGVVGSDSEGARVMRALGLSVRAAKKGSRSWRYETCFAEYAEALHVAHTIVAAFPEARIVESARLVGKKKHIRDGNSLGFIPAASVRRGMAVCDETGGYDIVENVEYVPARQNAVYDIDIAGTHNFIANGIVTHNSIYSWRGAELEHLLAFEETFPGTKVVTLEQNYRSTQIILEAANAVIQKNLRRKDKRLFTEEVGGDLITTYTAPDEAQEARFVVEKASTCIAQGVNPSSIAVLYRENFISRALEEAFLHAGVPYRVLGTRFFDRKEVKDVLSFIRFATHPESRADLARIIAVTPGLGPAALIKMVEGSDEKLGSAARVRVSALRERISRVARSARERTASETVLVAIKESGLEDVCKNGGEEGRDRLENMQELASFAMRYDALPAGESVERLLEDAALASEQDSLEKKVEAVSLMTVHASKGLEFDAVFVVGLEQGLFPSTRGDDEDRDSEEERRLFYVAITRARRHLFLTNAASRARYGEREYTIPSEFLDDIDQKLVHQHEEKRPVGGVRRGGILDWYEEEIT